jgi:uncharacterized protein YjcR
MPSGYRFKPNTELADVICKLYLYGFSCESISNFVGCSPVTIARFLDRKDVGKRPGGMVE